MSNPTHHSTPIMIPLRQIEENPVALRKVNKEDDDYKRVRDSIGKVGLQNAISVTPSFMGDGKSPKLTEPDGLPIYRIIDGAHRTSACRELGFTDMPALVMSASDLEVAKKQFVANAARVKTKPFEFAHHLDRIMASDITMTLVGLAAEVSQSVAWIGKLLGLVNLDKSIGALVDKGQISVANAADLAKLKPTEEQLKFIQDAMSDKPEIFAPKVKARIKELRDAKRQARDPNAEPEFVAVAHFRKKPEVEQELASGAPTILALAKAKGLTDPEDLVRLTLEYVLHLDEQSVTQAKAKHDQREQERKAESAKRTAERAEKTAKDQREIAARIEAAGKVGV